MTTATMPSSVRRDFPELTLQVRAAGLLDRRLGYYSAKILLTLGAFAAAWAGFFVVGASWATLGVAVFLGVISTQIGFLGHDAGHRQIFASPRANRLLGLILGNGLIGLSFGWWVPKHNAHHAHPNEVDRDPDIGVGLVRASSAGEQAGLFARFTRWMEHRQAELFFPLMVLRSAGLYITGVQELYSRRDRSAYVEGFLLAMYGALYLTAVFWVLPPAMAIAFIVVHQAVFSFYLGCSFAPNHKGMPLIAPGADSTFVCRQVITARNLIGGRCTNFAFGGLNYQIEHHLFPTMPRPNLARAQDLVRGFCAETGLEYCEASALGSFRQAFRHLQLAGRSAFASV